MSTRVLLVDDHGIFREGLRLLIARDLPSLVVVGQAGSVAQARESARELKPDLVIMDIHLPDGNGIQLSQEIITAQPGVRVIVLSAEPNLTFVRDALRVGVCGYLLKTNAPTELPVAIRTVLEGRLYLCQEASQAALEDYRDAILGQRPGDRPALSTRELEVLRLICEGLRTKEIADRLQVGVKTAETYRRRLATKLGCESTAELVRYALREGIVSG